MPSLFVIRKGVECFLHACNFGKIMNPGLIYTGNASSGGRDFECKTLEVRLMGLRLLRVASRAELCGRGFLTKQIADKTIQSVLAAGSGVRGMWCFASVAQLDRASDF